MKDTASLPSAELPPLPKPVSFEYLHGIYWRPEHVWNGTLAIETRALYTEAQLLDFARAAQQAPAPSVHLDDLAVDAFAAAMKQKLALAREKGRGGWETCPAEPLQEALVHHVHKGDPRDVANFCMMLWSRGERTVLEEQFTHDALGKWPAPSVQPPEGWKLVPVEPTDAMVEAWATAAPHESDRGGTNEEASRAWATADWQAMLAAAAAPQVAPAVQPKIDYRAECWPESPFAEPVASAPTTEGARLTNNDHSYLCQAWGESDLPCVAVVHDLASIRAFLVEQWLGDADATDWDDTPTLPRVMAEIEAHDWSDEKEWSVEFEIGGVSVERVYDTTPPTEASAGEKQQ